MLVALFNKMNSIPQRPRQMPRLALKMQMQHQPVVRERGIR